MNWILLAALAALNDGNTAPVEEEAVTDAPAEEPVALALREPTPEERAAQERAQRLVSGAPLYNPNVAVHIVQRKAFADGGKRELVLYPAVPRPTAVHPALRDGGVVRLPPARELRAAGHPAVQLVLQRLVVQPGAGGQGAPGGLAASTLLLNWGLQGGVEVTPLYGKFAFFDSMLAQFQVVLTGGAGIGSTRHLLRPAAQASRPRSGTPGTSSSARWAAASGCSSATASRSGWRCATWSTRRGWTR